MSGIIYCLQNQAMPDLVKIGKTSIDIEQRLRSLDNTSIPLPFECVLALEVEAPGEAERLLHEAFGDHRIRKAREFFAVNPSRVIAAMRLTKGVDVTPTPDYSDDPDTGRAVEAAHKIREAFNFQMGGIEPGTEIYFRANADDDGSITATVHSHNRIVFEGEETSLSAAAARIQPGRGYKGSSTAGPTYWCIDGESLDERRSRMEREGVDSNIDPGVAFGSLQRQSPTVIDER